MLLGNTGDSMLMKLMRHIAKKKGWCLNEFGMGQKVSALPLPVRPLGDLALTVVRSSSTMPKMR